MVSEQDPELKDRQGANPGDGEETNPLDAKGNSKAETSADQPEPPAGGEGLGRSLLMLVREGVECEGGEACGSYKRRVEEDQSCLGEQAVLCSPN